MAPGYGVSDALLLCQALMTLKKLHLIMVKMNEPDFN